MPQPDIILGIDLGTTNSEVAACINGRVKILGPADNPMLSSCVGLAPNGSLLVGVPARNQQLVYPERTVRSIKRKMGSSEKITLGDREFTPPEISALILRELVEWATQALGTRPQRAVITVPAYFSDAQRQATREAGALAGLEVVRILNEPTAASLAYGEDDGRPRTALVYDLGGGTFDVSLVRIEGEVTEVLASHGNNRLGGDDFTDRLATRLQEEFRRKHHLDLAAPEYLAARSRLWWAAEEAKKRLSSEPFVTVREENLLTRDGAPLHLEVEISRVDYENLIRPLIEDTFACVTQVLQDAGKTARQLDDVLLVGGSTRTPLVVEQLRERTGMSPRQDVHPDLCVALGAGILASRLAGEKVDKVLVDVSPFSFGVACIKEKDGMEDPHGYQAIIQRNTPLPVTRTDVFFTRFPYQDKVEVEIFQGEDPDARRNIPLGNFRFTGIAGSEDAQEILCKMQLDIDGILRVTAIQKRTGKTMGTTIDNALRVRTAAETAAARAELEELYKSRVPDELDDENELDENLADDLDEEVLDDDDSEVEGLQPAEANQDWALVKDQPAATTPAPDSPWGKTCAVAEELLARSRAKLDTLHPDDQEEAIDLHERIENARAAQAQADLESACKELREFLFFVEGK